MVEERSLEEQIRNLSSLETLHCLGLNVPYSYFQWMETEAGYPHVKVLGYELWIDSPVAARLEVHSPPPLVLNRC